MEKLADLHIHTYFSDSTSSPEEVIEQAYKQQLSCIAITDHDVVDGVALTMKAGEKYGIEVIPGIELSSEIHGKDIHVLGYFVDYENPAFKEKVSTFQDTRMERMKGMILKLRELGIDGISLEEVCALTNSRAVGRPHLASILVKKGVVKDLKEAFDKFLADEAPAYVPKFKQSPYEAIKLILSAGGVPVLAHPMFTNVDELIPQFVKAGLKGLEVYYPNTTENILRYYKGLAEKNNLIMTGGSDAHGEAKKNTYLGKMKIPYELVEKLKAQVNVKA
jgi:predicted metal-dependent phosphoesterase TrpH